MSQSERQSSIDEIKLAPSRIILVLFNPSGQISFTRQGYLDDYKKRHPNTHIIYVDRDDFDEAKGQIRKDRLDKYEVLTRATSATKIKIYGHGYRQIFYRIQTLATPPKGTLEQDTIYVIKKSSVSSPEVLISSGAGEAQKIQPNKTLLSKLTELETEEEITQESDPKLFNAITSEFPFNLYTYMASDPVYPIEGDQKKASFLFSPKRIRKLLELVPSIAHPSKHASQEQQEHLSISIRSCYGANFAGALAKELFDKDNPPICSITSGTKDKMVGTRYIPALQKVYTRYLKGGEEVPNYVEDTSKSKLLMGAVGLGLSVAAGGVGLSIKNCELAIGGGAGSAASIIALIVISMGSHYYGWFKKAQEAPSNSRDKVVFYPELNRTAESPKYHMVSKPEFKARMESTKTSPKDPHQYSSVPFRSF